MPLHHPSEQRTSLELWCTASFICGMDSPVSVASFSTAVPRSRRQSQGTMSLSLLRVRENRSPGTSSVVLVASQLPRQQPWPPTSAPAEPSSSPVG